MRQSGSRLHGDGDLIGQIGRARGDDGRAQQAVAFGGDQFEEAVGVAFGLRPVYPLHRPAVYLDAPVAGAASSSQKPTCATSGSVNTAQGTAVLIPRTRPGNSALRAAAYPCQTA